MKSIRRELLPMLLPVIVLTAAGLALRLRPGLLPANGRRQGLFIKDVRYQESAIPASSPAYDTKVEIDIGYAGGRPAWLKPTTATDFKSLQGGLQLGYLVGGNLRPVMERSGKAKLKYSYLIDSGHLDSNHDHNLYWTIKLWLSLRHVSIKGEIRVRDKLVLLNGSVVPPLPMGEPLDVDVIVRKKGVRSVLPCD